MNMNSMELYQREMSLCKCGATGTVVFIPYDERTEWPAEYVCQCSKCEMYAIDRNAIDAIKRWNNKVQPKQEPQQTTRLFILVQNFSYRRSGRSWFSSWFD
mgnify:CR=1 FL=1